MNALRSNLINLQARSCLVRKLVSKTKTETVSPDVTPKPRKKRAPKDSIESKIPKELLGNYDSPEDIKVLASFPDKFLKKKTTSDIFYMANEKQASHIADIITKDLRPDQTLLEANPGLGFVTKHLLEKTSNNLILYESTSSFVKELSVSVNFALIWKYFTQSLIILASDCALQQ
jgi:Ribosomal RNA adenine dimethylase